MPYFNTKFRGTPAQVTFRSRTSVSELAAEAMDLTVELARQAPEHTFLVTARAVYRGNIFAANHGDADAVRQLELLVEELNYIL